MNEAEQAETAAQIDQWLKTTKLPVSEEDYAWFIKNYGRLRKMAEVLRLSETRYAEPALLYAALPQERKS